MSLDALVVMIQCEFPGATVRTDSRHSGSISVVVCFPRLYDEAVQVPLRVQERIIQTTEGRRACCDMIRAELLENPMLPAAYAHDGGDRSLGIQEFVGAEHYNVSPLLTGRITRDSGFHFLEPAGVPEVDYARDLADAPTFTEALAALEAHKARRKVG